jgi:nucleoside-diphosphate-sugar epimerase
MRVLLTGASGFVGSHLLARFLRTGEHALAVVLRPGAPPRRIGHLLKQVEIIEGDLARPEALAEPMRRFGPDLVLHAAWAGPNTKNRDHAQHADHVIHTIELAKLAHATGARHFIGIGSQAEYGAAAVRTDEEQPARPVTLYGTAKLCAGLLAGKLCSTFGIRFAWVRLFAAYGPEEDPAWLIPSMCRALLAGQRPATTPGEQRWDYLYVEDAAEAIHRVAVVPRATGTFNLGSGRVNTIRKVIEIIRDLINPQAPVGFGELAYGPHQVMHMEANIDRLRQATGWEPETDLATGLRRTVDWFRQAYAVPPPPGTSIGCTEGQS